MDTKHTRAEVEMALLNTGGVIKDTAARLKVSRPTVYSYMRKWPDLVDVRTEAEDAMLDECETCIFEAVSQKRNWQAAKFVLETKGRHRGWGKSEPIPKDRDDQIDFIKKKLGQTGSQAVN